MRLHDRRFKHPVHWSRAGWYRFDSPDAPFGVCYAGLNVATAFLEVFGDKVRHSRRLARSAIARYDVYSVNVSPHLKVLALEGVNLAKVGATMGCFAGPYPLSQRWGDALMRHPAMLDGLVYVGRRSGARCLAVFGDDATPKKHQDLLRVTRVGALAEALEFWQVADELELAVF
ncbi:MAG: RES family NAD+ phosphorylase [Opitutaceae bacterium]